MSDGDYQVEIQDKDIKETIPVYFENEEFIDPISYTHYKTMEEQQYLEFLNTQDYANI